MMNFVTDVSRNNFLSGKMVDVVVLMDIMKNMVFVIEEEVDQEIILMEFAKWEHILMINKEDASLVQMDVSLVLIVINVHNVDHNIYLISKQIHV